MAEPKPELESFRSAPRPLAIRGVVQHYAWGGYEFIPELLGVSNPERRPFAELWIGSHPKAPALAQLDGGELGLDELLEQELPYLLKVLDVRGMLSIQAHPTKAQAEEGYRREDEAGVALDAPQRSYRDRNHKPEAHVAVTDFYMLHGFRPLQELASLSHQTPELAPLMSGFEAGAREPNLDAAAQGTLVQALYEHVMTRPQEEIDALLAPLVERLLPRYWTGELTRESPDFWAARAAQDLPLPGGHHDRGIVSIYLLNLVKLRPGEGTCQPAGVLHAYLEGVTIEAMANSDNVLRGGLTPKHVDVPELLRTLRFAAGRPAVLEGQAVSESETTYPTAAPEFLISRLELGGTQAHEERASGGIRCLVVLEGEVVIEHAAGRLRLARGGCALIPAGCSCTLTSELAATLYRASVPPSGS